MSRRRRPKAKHYARWVCIVSRVVAKEMRSPTIAYRCHSLAHTHLKREEVDHLVRCGDMQWVGDHCRVATYAEHKIWAKTPSEEVSTMQLVEPAEVYARRKR